VRPASRDALARALDALGIDDAHRDELLARARPEVVLALAPSDAPVGASKIGGAPDLPDDTSWPVDREGRPLSIVAQLDLASLPAIDRDLPREGTLSFFYDTVGQPPGDAPGDEASLAVVWNAPKPLRRRDSHPDAEEFPERALTPTVAWGPPRGPVAWPTDEAAGEAFVNAWVGEAPEAKLLGHPDTLQEAMEGVCEALSRGDIPAVDAGRLALDDPRRDRWVLLLQLGSDGAAAFSFGSGSGRLYVWIPRDALRARDFSRARALVQDT
jgi:uncharacterized protein YwqG